MNETETKINAKGTETIFTLRLPDDLKDRLDMEADREERSRHGQIIKILRDRYAQQGQQEQQAA